MEKRAITTIISITFILLTIGLISAIDLDISSKLVQNSVITDLDEPAVFDLTIRNLGETSSFEIYSLVGIDISPETLILIDSGQTKTIQIQVMPQEHLKSSEKGYFTFEYKIKNTENEIQKERLTINIVKIEEAIAIIPENINPKSEIITLSVQNKINYDFGDLEIQIDSAFFNYKDTLSLKESETKQLQINIDKEKLKALQAGPYLLNTKIKTQGKTADIESIVKFLKQEGIETNEVKEGVLIKRHEITKTNVGNVRKIIEVTVPSNLASHIFTTFNQAPEVKINGLRVTYSWEKELIPNEELKIIIKTNWFLPFIIILFIIVLFILIKKYVESDLILRKKVSFVKTKGGEFALKITIRAKARSFIERIHIIDKLPHLVKLYDRYGAITPDKIDLRNRRIEWNVESLNKDEERIFSYIIYSKIGVVGRFELPSAKAVYEKEGKIKEVESNRSFFINEQKN